MSKNWFLLSSIAFGVSFGLSLPINRDIKQALLNGLMAIPATTASVLAVDSLQKRKAMPILITLESEIQVLEERKQSLCQNLERIETQHEQVQEQLQQQQDEKQKIEAAISALQAQRREFLAESYRLEVWLRELRTQEKRLNQSLSALAIEQQQFELGLQQSSSEINRSHPQEQTPKEQTPTAQIDESTLEWLEALRATLLLELETLETNRSTLTQRSQALELQIQHLQHQEEALARSARQLLQQKQQLEAEVQHLSPTVAALQQQQNHLTHEITELSAQRNLLRSLLDQLQEQVEIRQDQLNEALEQAEAPPRQDVDNFSIAAPEVEEQPSEAVNPNQDTVSLVDLTVQEGLDVTVADVQDSGVETSAERLDLGTQVKESKGRYGFDALELIDLSEAEDYDVPASKLAFRLWNFEHTRWLWEGVILPRWTHQPFLGSVNLPHREVAGIWGTEDILDVVGSSLRDIGTNNIEGKLYDRCSADTQQNWLKIVTFAISEYAYSESQGKFWQGLCDRLGLPYHADEREPVRTLKDLVQNGIDLLRLPKAVGGYPIVSTLWLQSGIPRSNLYHFAELTKDLVEQYGWQYFVQTEAAQVAKILLTTCQIRYPGRTVLTRFLEYSCGRNVEPFSARILQTIATVAIALQQRHLQPKEVLLDPNRRAEFFQDLPQSSFFLRDWEAFVEILTPESKPISDDRRNKGVCWLELVFDLDEYCLQLVLPEQRLHQPDWQSGWCTIPEISWHEGYIDSQGNVEIPEHIEVLETIEESWQWQLCDESQTVLYTWTYAGASDDLPCLLFDAWTGDRLLPTPHLSGHSEIFCFVPVTVGLTWEGIEAVEESIDCGIADWQGWRFRRVLANAKLTLQVRNQHSVTQQSIELKWTDEIREPVLRGLKLRGQKAPYLEIPTIWYPPAVKAVSLTLSIQDLLRQGESAPSVTAIEISSGDRWQEISLVEWILVPGSYKVRISSQEMTWAEQFEVLPHYQVGREAVAAAETHQVLNCSGASVVLPLCPETDSQFWLTKLKLVGLWALEPIRLILTADQQQISLTRQADASGVLQLESTTLHDRAPSHSQFLAIDYQRLGALPQRLIEFDLEAQQFRYSIEADAVQLSGLKLNQTYVLHCWNLLLPEQLASEISVPAGKSVNIPLLLEPGIYYLQLQGSEQERKNLGWWSNYQLYELPQATQQDERIENYCYAILDNELMNEFLNYAKQIHWNQEWLESIAADFGCVDRLPPELDAKGLQAKLQAILVPPSGEWYVVSTADGKRGDFRDELQRVIAQNDLWQLILDCQNHPDRKHKNQLLIQVADVPSVRSYLSKIPYFDWMSRQPASSDEIALM